MVTDKPETSFQVTQQSIDRDWIEVHNPVTGKTEKYYWDKEAWSTEHDNAIKHLLACEKSSSELQRDIINVGAKYMNVRNGEAYSVKQAWEAIKRELDTADELAEALEAIATEQTGHADSI